MNLATRFSPPADGFAGSCPRTRIRRFHALLFAALAFLLLAGGARAQNPLSRPILFVHGWCGSGYDWSPFFGTNALFTLLPSSLYPNQSVYLVEYDSVTNTISYWLENDPAAGSGTTLTSVAEADIPSTARFFAINFYDPNPSSTNPTDPTNVAAISILNKAYEVAEVVQHIETITQVDQVNVLAHSMGGLDARAYVENMASVGACYSYASSTPNYTAPTCTPGAGSAAWDGNVANIITLDTPNAGSPLVDSSLRSYLASYGYECEASNTTNSAEMSPGNSLLQSLNYAGVELGGASPVDLGTPVQALEDYASDVTRSWTGLTGYSDDVVQVPSQSITENIPAPDTTVTLTDISLPYPSSTIKSTSGCNVDVLGTEEPLIHFLSCLGALEPTVQAVANQLIDDTVPWITGWSVTPTTISLGQSVTIQYSAVDLSTYTLTRAELWRAPDVNGAPGTWAEVDTPQVLSGNGPTAIIFTDTPDTAGKFWYGTHVYDSGGNEATNPTNTQVTVNPLIPTVTTGAATAVLTTSATLNGSINPNGGATQYLFLYGTDPGLAGATATSTYNLSAGTSAQNVQAGLINLNPGKTYYFELEAWNSADSMASPATGGILSFNTQNATKVTPAVSVTPGSYNITTLQSLSVTIGVTGSNGTATGSVTLSGGGYTSPAAATLSGGSATIVIPAGALALGADTLSASYTPDANSSSLYNSATGSSAAVTVNSSVPTVTVTPASFSITTLETLSVMVTVAGSNGTPTGSVTLSGGGYSSTATALSGGSATIVIPAGALALGSDTLSASYTPDGGSSGTYSGSTGTSSAVMVNSSHPTVTVTPGSYNITTLQSLSVMVTVTGSNGTPTGSVTLSGDGYSSLATGLSGGSATIVIPAGALALGSDTLSASYVPDGGSSGIYSGATGTSSAVMVGSPPPGVGATTPLYTRKGLPAFALTVSGSGFTPTSTVYWGGIAVTTDYGSGTELTAQIPSTNIADPGIAAVTVVTPAPGGGTSSSFEFEVDSAGASDTPPSFTTLTATLTAGSTATYPVTLASDTTNVSAICLNLPNGAACSYSPANYEVSISTSGSTPAGTYPITVVFTETLPGAATGLVLMPLLLLPLAVRRRKWTAGRIWLMAGLGLALTVAAGAVGCGGGRLTLLTPVETHQITISGAVNLTVE